MIESAENQDVPEVRWLLRRLSLALEGVDYVALTDSVRRHSSRRRAGIHPRATRRRNGRDTRVSMACASSTTNH
jgi:hypothetical protein